MGGHARGTDVRLVVLSVTTDPASLPDRELAEMLERLESEERSVSRRRTALHNRIDFLRTGGHAAELEHEDIPHLLENERLISERRRELHLQIDALRAERSRRRRGL